MFLTVCNFGSKKEKKKINVQKVFRGERKTIFCGFIPSPFQCPSFSPPQHFCDCFLFQFRSFPQFHFSLCLLFGFRLRSYESNGKRKVHRLCAPYVHPHSIDCLNTFYGSVLCAISMLRPCTVHSAAVYYDVNKYAFGIMYKNIFICAPSKKKHDIIALSASNVWFFSM